MGVAGVPGWARGLSAGALAVSHAPFGLWLAALWEAQGFVAVQSIITPFIIAGLIYLRRGELSALRSPSGFVDGRWRWGVGLSVAVAVASTAAGVPSWMAISAPLGVWSHLRWTRRAEAVEPFAIPVALLIFLVPANYSGLWQLSLQLQVIAAQIATWSLQWAALPAFRDGVVVVTGATCNAVTDSCSGMSTFTALFFYALVFGFIFRLRVRETAVVVLTLLPLVLLTNGLRVALISWLLYTWGEGVANGPLHDGSGIVIYGLSFGVLLALMRHFNARRSAQSSAKIAIQPSPTAL